MTKRHPDRAPPQRMSEHEIHPPPRQTLKKPLMEGACIINSDIIPKVPVRHIPKLL